MSEKELLTKKFILVDMNDAMISTEERTIIGTHALSTCIGVLLYDEEKKLAIVAHIVPDKVDAIDKIFAIIIKNKLWSTKFKYKIIPGYYPEHYNTSELIEKHLTNFTPFNEDEIPANAIRRDDESESCKFAFDASTGTFVTDKVYFGIDYYKINEVDVTNPNQHIHR